MLRCFDVKAGSTNSCRCPIVGPAKHVMSMHAEDDGGGMLSYTLPYFTELHGINVRANRRDSPRNYKNSVVTQTEKRCSSAVVCTLC